MASSSSRYLPRSHVYKPKTIKKVFVPFKRSGGRSFAVSELSSTQEEFRAQVARFVVAEITPNATAWDRDESPHPYPMHLFAKPG